MYGREEQAMYGRGHVWMRGSGHIWNRVGEGNADIHLCTW